MSFQVGPYFEMVVRKSAIDDTYIGGAEAFISMLGCGEILDGFIVWGSMSGFDQIFDQIEQELNKLDLNIKHDDENCVYVKTELYREPKQKRTWFRSEKDEQGRALLFLVN